MARIGEDFIFQRRVTRDGSSQNDIFPIPSDLQPFLSVLRSIVDRTATKTLATYPHNLASGPSGWKLSLEVGGAAGRDNLIVLDGCGNLLTGVQLQLRNHERRHIVFMQAS